MSEESDEPNGGPKKAKISPELRAKVLSLAGDGRVPPGEPCPHCIKAVESLLEEAKAGELRAISCIAMNGAGHYRYVVAGLVNAATMIGWWEKLKDQFKAMLD